MVPLIPDEKADVPLIHLLKNPFTKQNYYEEIPPLQNKNNSVRTEYKSRDDFDEFPPEMFYDESLSSSQNTIDSRSVLRHLMTKKDVEREDLMNKIKSRLWELPKNTKIKNKKLVYSI